MLYIRQPLEVGLDEGFRFSKSQIAVSRQAVCAHTVNQAKVNPFSKAALVISNALQRNIINSRSRRRMNILPLSKCRQQCFVLADMRQHPQFNLAVIHRKQFFSCRGDKCPTHFAPKVGTDGDVLQVWAVAAQAPGGSPRLVIARMHPPRYWIHQCRQCIDIRPLQFG